MNIEKEVNNWDKDRLSIKQIVFGVFLVIFVCLGITWIIQGNDFFMYKVFAPKYEAARRQVFENTRSFNQGMVQELDNMRFAYIKEKDPNARQALASIIIHRSEGFNLNDPIVPYDLRSFINDLKNEKSK